MTTRTDQLTRQQLRKQINSKGETAYVCDTCTRKIRVPANKYSVDVIQRCIITKNCAGRMRPVATAKEAAEVSSVPPAVAGLVDWSQRQILYTHNQTIESAVWTIEHNLKNMPSVSTHVYRTQDGNDVLFEITPLQVTTINENTTRITFDRAYKGVAQLLATASAVTKNTASVSTAAAAATVSTISNNGEITIATLDSSAVINFNARFFSSAVAAGYVDTVYVGVDNTSSVLSPWVGVKKVFLGGKSYTVRSFNVRTHEMAKNAFNNNLITNGSPFYFTFTDNTLGRNLILLGNAPFGPVDRITSSYIDIAAINTDRPELAMSNGEVIVSSSVVKGTYPPIIAVD